jgi:hypothetical protein
MYATWRNMPFTDIPMRLPSSVAEAPSAPGISTSTIV